MDANKVTKTVLKHLVIDAPIATAAALSALDPTYAAIWAGTTTLLNQMTVNERETFADELLKKELTQELLESVEFARATKVTIRAAANTAHKEKIKKLARLLRNGTNEHLIRDFDEYKEFAKLIDEISPREFILLKTMEYKMESGGMFGKTPPPFTLTDEQNPKQWTRRANNNAEVNVAKVGDTPAETITTLEYNWRGAEYRIKQELNISSETLRGMMNRLVRTGCIVPEGIHAWDKDVTVFRLTPLYFRLENYIKQDAPDFDEFEDPSWFPEVPESNE